MKRISYTTKVRLATTAILLVIVGFFGITGYRSTHQLFALTPAPAGVYIYTDKTDYRIGQDITVTIANSTPRDIYVINNCPQQPFRVYHLSDRNWSSVTATTNSSKCNGEPKTYRIPANRSMKVGCSYWPQLFIKSGEYQIDANLASHSSGPSTTFFVSE